MTEDVTKGPILEIPKRVFKGDNVPTHVPQILKWIDNEPQEFSRLLGYFDQVVGDFNARTVESVDPSCQNFHIVKGILDTQKLPTIGELLAESGVGPILNYRTVVRLIKEMMEQGDKPEKERMGRSVGYHRKETDPKVLVIASIFHTYEELVQTREGIKGRGIEEDRIIEGLMEIASEHLELPLFSALSRKDGMNWVDNYDRFTQEFCQKNGFS